MRIQIRERDGVHLTLLFPTGVAASLLSSRLAGKLIQKALEEKCPKEVGAVFSESVIRKAQKELKKSLKDSRHLTLVEVESAGGDYVKVIL